MRATEAEPKCAWPGACVEPPEFRRGSLDYCYEHLCEVDDVRRRLLAPPHLLIEDDQLLAYLKLSPKKQLSVGQRARQAASKGLEVQPLPRCEKCDRISVLDPCAKCARPIPVVRNVA